MKRMNIPEVADIFFFQPFLNSCHLSIPLLSAIYSVLIQKRLKKEKRNKRRLQEALEEEVKLRDQAEHTLLHTATAHTGKHRKCFIYFLKYFTRLLFLLIELSYNGLSHCCIACHQANATKP